MTDRGRERPKLALVPPADDADQGTGEEQPFDVHASRIGVIRRFVAGVLGPAMIRRGFTVAEIVEALEAEAYTWRLVADRDAELGAMESEDP